MCNSKQRNQAFCKWFMAHKESKISLQVYRNTSVWPEYCKTLSVKTKIMMFIEMKYTNKRKTISGQCLCGFIPWALLIIKMRNAIVSTLQLSDARFEVTAIKCRKCPRQTETGGNAAVSEGYPNICIFSFSGISMQRLTVSRQTDVNSTTDHLLMWHICLLCVQRQTEFPSSKKLMCHKS